MNSLFLRRRTPLQRLIQLKRLRDRGTPITKKTVSGSIVHITDALADPVKSLIAYIEPVQDLHGQPNPYPAGGGVNKFNPSNATGVATAASYGLTVTVNADESIRVHGTPTWADGTSSPSFNILDTTDDYSGLTGNVFVVSKSSNITSVNSVSFTLSTHRIAVNVTKTGTDAVDFTIKISFASASQSAWAPYSNECPIAGWTECEISRSGADTSNPKVYDVIFPVTAGTVYGGTLENRGTNEWKLKATMAEVDLGSLDWQHNPQLWSGLFGNNSLTDRKYAQSIHPICSLYKYNGTVHDAILAATDKTFSFYWNENYTRSYIYVCDRTYSDAETFKAAMSGVKLIYELAEPIEYTITDEAVIMLLSENNIWADTGDVKVTYLAGQS